MWYQEAESKVMYEETNAAMTALKNRIRDAEQRYDASCRKLDDITKGILKQQNDFEFAVSLRKHQVNTVYCQSQETLGKHSLLSVSGNIR